MTTTDVKILATIELDPTSEFAGERGKLYWSEGDIWCELPNGQRQATETGCTEDRAIDTIQAAWGNSWDLQWVDDSEDESAARKIAKIEVIWDDNHGTGNEGWYTRTHYSDGQQEDNPVDDSADATDAELIARYSDGKVIAAVVR